MSPAHSMNSVGSRRIGGVSVVTKKGDEGRTQLYFGESVHKDDARVEAYGTLDELCSFLGMARSIVKPNRFKKLLESIQRDLFVIGAEIATTSRNLRRLDDRINKTYIRKLEIVIDEIEGKNVFEGCCFYLPGEDAVSASLDIARTVARRAERRVVTLKNKRILKNKYLLIYLNRLSDLLYLLARYYEKGHRRVK